MELDFWRRSQALVGRQAVESLMQCNEFTGPYGLCLNETQALILVERRGQGLSTSGRIEFGAGIVEKLIRAFCDSPYLDQHDYAETVGDLTTIFYEFKNETMDLLTDDELINMMEQYFNGPCQGSLELLEERELPRMAHNLRIGRSPNARDLLMEEDRLEAEEEERDYAGD